MTDFWNAKQYCLVDKYFRKGDIYICHNTRRHPRIRQGLLAFFVLNRQVLSSCLVKYGTFRVLRYVIADTFKRDFLF